MFINDFTDEQYLELRLTNPSNVFNNFMNVRDDERIVGWASVKITDDFYLGLIVDEKCFYQIVHQRGIGSGRYILRSHRMSYFINSLHKLDQIINGELIKFTDDITINPEGPRPYSKDKFK